MPVDVVSRLYEAERIWLEVGALCFHPSRSVRKLLRRSGDTPVIFPAVTHPHRILE